MIKILNDSIINKIAAGEVIERPSNVVKELLENSFDSGADNIKIEIFSSGLKKIKISDNGSGMSKEDLLLSYKRHATSKIYNESDLFNIHSLGFRGEALASIAEISNLKIKSKTKNSNVGYCIEVESGKLLSSEPCGCPEGTIVEVQDIFFNVPARKNYLKSPEIEFSHILSLIEKYALIKNNVSIKLYHNFKEIFSTTKSDSLLTNILSLYGPEITENLIKVDYSENNISVLGFISKPNLTRADKSDQSLYVNFRYVKNKIITSAVYDAYGTLLFINRHPIYVLNINISPDEIDVNVHPTKSLIRIKDEKKIYDVVFNAIKKSLDNNDLIPKSLPTNETNAKPTTLYQFTKDRQSVLDSGKNLAKTNTYFSISYEKKSNINNKKRFFEELYVFGQINKTYIIAENPQGLVILDQHAAEERVNYEKFMKELSKNAVKTQNLLHPKIIELNPLKYSIVLNYKDFLLKLGFLFEDFGGNSIKLLAVPEIFSRLKSTLFLDIINELANSKQNSLTKEIEERIIRFSCRASVKAGEELTIIQIKELLRKLSECENPYTCPHGRPTMISLTNSDLEKKFKRTGW